MYTLEFKTYAAQISWLINTKSERKKDLCCLFYWMNGFLTHLTQKTAAQSAGYLPLWQAMDQDSLVWRLSSGNIARQPWSVVFTKHTPTQAQSNQYTSHPKDPSEPDKQFGIPRNLLPSYIQTVTTDRTAQVLLPLGNTVISLFISGFSKLMITVNNLVLWLGKQAPYCMLSLVITFRIKTPPQFLLLAFLQSSYVSLGKVLNLSKAALSPHDR